ncbi:MAG: hypothetical protein ACPG2Y_00420 [Acholeplasmataceae bacterium]
MKFPRGGENHINLVDSIETPGLFIECPFYQTRYVVGSDIYKYNMAKMAPKVVSRQSLLMSIQVSDDEKWDLDFCEKLLMENSDSDDDDDHLTDSKDKNKNKTKTPRKTK